MSKFIVIVFVSLLVTSTVVLSSNTLSQKTVLFSKYLKNEYNLTLSDSNQAYLVIQAVGCETCRSLDFNFLKVISQNNDIIIILIYPRRAKLPKSLTDISTLKNVFLDRGEFNKLNIMPNTDSLIFTESQNIIEINELKKANREEILLLLKKLKH